MLIGVPGLAKTHLVQTLGTVLGLDTSRVQFTPDLMPADITGSEVMEECASGARSFRFIRGPVFTQLLMADEINRASPRTQSALLQAMQENQVTVAGARHDSAAPFHVLATQNPLEQEGTYPLPEAQLDRFLLQIDVGYPDLEAERQMLLATTGRRRGRGGARAAAAEDCWMRRPGAPHSGGREGGGRDSRSGAQRRGPEFRSSTAVSAARSPGGPGPRASQALMLAVRARALLRRPLRASRDDVVALAGPVLRHRMALNFAARAEGATTAERDRALVAPSGERAAPVRRSRGAGAGLPALMVEADQLAATVSLGVHGRRRAGLGESFWQFAATSRATRRR